MFEINKFYLKSFNQIKKISYKKYNFYIENYSKLNYFKIRES